MLGSLKQLDELLKSTFKNSNKSAGTTHSSDTELTNVNGTTIPLTINDDSSTRTIDMEPDAINKTDERQQNSNPIVTSFVQSESNTPSLVMHKLTQQIPTDQVSTYFDPLVLTDKKFSELDLLTKATHERTISNDDTIVSTSSNEFSELKSMISDISKVLINRMDTIEQKIDEQKYHTLQINNLLRTTVLPAFIDLATIIHETPNIDPRVRYKLETIQMNIKQAQQHRQIDMKDLMDI